MRVGIVDEEKSKTNKYFVFHAGFLLNSSEEQIGSQFLAGATRNVVLMLQH